MWYLTSLEPITDSGSRSSNSAKICRGLCLERLASTLSRPRWAMPRTISLDAGFPGKLDEEIEQRDQRLPPSSEKRFAPTYLVCRNCSSTSASISRSRCGAEPRGRRQTIFERL